MKKLSAILVGMSLVAGAVMAAGPVTSVNAVGYAKRVLPPNSLIMCGAGFTPMGESGINQVFTNQLTGGIDSSSSDLILKWDSSNQVYQTAWKVNGGTGGNAVYNGKWYTDDGEWPPTPSPMTFNAGDGFWIWNVQSITQEVVFAGEVLASNLSTNQLNSELNMVSYAYAAATEVNNPTNALSSVASGGFDSAESDLIILWDVATQSYVTLWQIAGATGGNAIYNGKWYLDDGEWPPTLAPNVINVGEGFWILRRASGSVSWIAGKPYSL